MPHTLRCRGDACDVGRLWDAAALGRSSVCWGLVDVGCMASNTSRMLQRVARVIGPGVRGIKAASGA